MLEEREEIICGKQLLLDKKQKEIVHMCMQGQSIQGERREKQRNNIGEERQEKCGKQLLLDKKEKETKERNQDCRQKKIWRSEKGLRG